MDASALLAGLFAERGHERVMEVLERSAISSANYSEVISRQIRMGAKAEAAVANLERIDLPVIEWDAEMASAAADLSPLAWTHGLSLGDRICLATARHKKLVALTADRKWIHLPPVGVQVEVIR
ncbi:MAG: type II toxin-antitoxin system VapC family toxin [Bryobacteraceae bacterium]